MSEIWFTSRSHSNGCDKNNNYITDDPTKTYAKTIIDNNSITFYIKGGKYAKLFNPNGFWVNSLGHYDKQENFDFWTWKQVTKNIFDAYLLFLRTENYIHLGLAEKLYLKYDNVSIEIL
jgi:hypothetical protein